MTASGRISEADTFRAPSADDRLGSAGSASTGPAYAGPACAGSASAKGGAEPDPPDLRSLFEHHYATVWRLLRRFGVPEAELDDQAQEVFWVAARRLCDMRAGRERAFLYGVALRVASNLTRRLRASPLAREPDQFELIVDPRPSPEEQLDQRQARSLLDAVLDRLPLELRTVFVLFELEGLSVAEIAELEGIPLGTASSRLRRAREEFAALTRRLQAALSNNIRRCR